MQKTPKIVILLLLMLGTVGRRNSARGVRLQADQF